MTIDSSITTKSQRLKRFLLEQAPTCVHKPEALLKYRYVTPSYAVVAGADDNASVSERSTVGHYLQMYDWDSCLFSQGATKAGLDNLAPDVVANFLSLKHGDGYTPRTVSPERIWDAGDMCKPFLCQALVFDNKHKSHKLSAEMVKDLECYLEYFQRNRQDPSGLYHWRNVLESGVDDNLALLAPHEAAKDENSAVGDFPDGKMLAVDLSSYMVAEFRAFALLCQQVGRPDTAEKYQRLSKELMALIEEKMWDQQAGMYFNLYPTTFEQLKLRAWTGLLPAMLSIARKERIEQVVNTNIMDENHFFRSSGMSTVAASESLYNNAKRGLYGRAIVSNWQGPMWVLPNALAARGLVQNGFHKEAEHLAARVINTMANGLDSHGTLFENYHADTGAPLWAPQFMSWNILALELIALVG